MRTVYTVKLREELSYHGLGASHYNRGAKCAIEKLGTLSDTEIDGAIVLATSDETGDVVIELTDGRVCIVHALDIDFFKDGIKQEVKQ
jgi:hypothetical protein